MRELHGSVDYFGAELVAVVEAYRSGPADSLLRRLPIAELFWWMEYEDTGTDKRSIKECGLDSMHEFMLDLIEAMRPKACGRSGVQDMLKQAIENALLAEDDP